MSIAYMTKLCVQTFSIFVCIFALFSSQAAGRGLAADPGLGGEMMSQHWERLGIPAGQSCSMWPRQGKSGAPCWSCCPRDPTPDKRFEDE